MTCGDPKMLMRAHLCMAEVRWLQGRKSVAVAHFLECRDLFFGLFMGADNRFLMIDGPVSFTRSALTILHRMVRFLITLEPASINRRLEIFDAALQMEADMGLRRQQTAKAMQSPRVEVGRRIWALLHCMRSNGRVGATRGLTADDLLRRNLSSLRKIYRFASSSCSSTPRSVNAGANKVSEDSPRAFGMTFEAPAADIFNDNSLNYEGNPELKSIADRHIYALCILEQLVIFYCPGTGIVEVRAMASSGATGLLHAGVINFIEGMILGHAPAEDDGKKTKSSSKNAQTTSSTASTRSLPATEGVGRAAVESSELYSMLKTVAGTLLSEKRSANILGSSERVVPAASIPAPISAKAKEKLWPRLWSPFARLAMKFHRPPPVPVKLAAAAPNAPLLMACSAILRVVPWEAACPGALVRTMGVSSCLAAIPQTSAAQAPAVRRSCTPQLVSLHSSKWQGRALSQSKLASARGTMVREWVSSMQIGVWPPGGALSDGGQGYSGWSCPMFSPLVKPRGLAATRRKYPWVSFLETDGVDFASQLLDSPDTVILLPYSDLLRFPAALTSELAQLHCCTLGFCPDVGFKPLVRMLRALMTDLSKSSEEGTPRDLRSALLSASIELNKDLGFPVVVLSHAWRIPLEQDSAGTNTKPSAAQGQAPTVPAYDDVMRGSRTIAAGGLNASAVAALLREVNQPSADEVENQKQPRQQHVCEELRSQQLTNIDPQGRLDSTPTVSADGLVHRPLEVEGGTLRTLAFPRQRSRRKDFLLADKSKDAAWIASQVLRPYGHNLSAEQAAEQQEMLCRFPQHSLAAVRVKGMRGRVAAEMSAVYSPRYESAAAPSSELSDAPTTHWMPDTESSGWLTSAEQTPSGTSAEPTPRSVGPGVLGAVISEEEENWDFDSEDEKESCPAHLLHLDRACG